MSKRTKDSSPAPAMRQKHTDRKPAKRPTNLTLDPEAVARGERFAESHGTSLSQLIAGFLYSLPDVERGDALPELTPSVRRLYGVAARGTVNGDDHRAHLIAKYGRR